MATDPRNIVAFESIDANYASFLADGVTIVYDVTQLDGASVTTIGFGVSLSASSTVQLCNDADMVIGRLNIVESDAKAMVQIEGFQRLPGGNGATLTLGTHIVGALGPSSAKGYIRSVNSSVAAELAKQAARIIDVSDTTNVIVDF
jgi:hypothetical protein